VWFVSPYKHGGAFYYTLTALITDYKPVHCGWSSIEEKKRLGDILRLLFPRKTYVIKKSTRDPHRFLWENRVPPGVYNTGHSKNLTNGAPTGGKKSRLFKGK